MFPSANAAHFALQIPGIRHDFKVLAFNGTEAISTLYRIDIELVSEHPDFDLESLLSQPAFLQLGLSGEGIHGRIEDVLAGEAGKRLTRYHLTLVPALYYLQFSHDQRIFQQRTVPQIIAQVLSKHGIQADAFTFHVNANAPRDYCTQYAESDFEFIQRLCAEDGIAWHHQHSVDGHLLVFTDDQVFLPKLGATRYQQDSGMVAEHSVVSRFSVRTSTRTSTVTRRDYDLKRPSLLLETHFTAEFAPTLEDYRYPLLLENEKSGKRMARQALERHRTDYELGEGQSDQANLRCGHLFEITEHPRKSCNELWLLRSVSHTGRQPQVLEESVTSDTQAADGFTQGYRNTFSVIPAEVVFRPPLPAPRRPLVCQTARVTGPAHEETHCDEFGRVKCEFNWDRAELNSERSSCWIRVSSSWAGESFGSVTIPRIGMEVVVTFLEGDPDKPLITGCVPNKVKSAPYTLPEHKTRTVLRSHSSPHTGGYNELMIEDRAGQEKIYLRAERDYEQLILNDSHSLIRHDRFQQVDNHSSSLIKADERHTTDGTRSTVIGTNDLLTISGNSSTTAGGTLVIAAGPHARVTASQVVIDAGTSLTLTAGGQHIVINAGGIFSSVPIVEGGAPMAGVAAISAIPSVAVPLQVPVLPHSQRLALMAKKPICAVCEATDKQSGKADA
ncbi:Rhs element Vgr protein [Pseudomonas fluorescens]|uniref:Rhs element Vgr protein n=1 Tax=Pseudomonas fluorescens TaxID=294 RepID=A0A3S4PPL5_PSEFL|nr:type VI secretion system tip protein TssI/VgrG [Pseudomonas fluorescens]VEF07612.1 Rhs element Vgr protein [Pseudomonas fluorescens]